MKHVVRILGLLAVAVIAILAWLGWPDTARLSLDAVAGRRPTIGQPREQLIPTVAIAKPVGWQGGAAPTPAAGLTAKPFATGLDHPRWLYRLPNGDVLVAETNIPAGQGSGVQGLAMRTLLKAAGAGTPSPNRITLLRDADGDGVAETRSVFMAGLNSPFGMVLFQGQLYVANTDALVRVPYTEGMTKVTAKPEVVIRYPGGGNHWTRNVIAAGDGRTLYLSIGSSSNVAENGLDAERTRANILQVWPKEKTYRIYAAGTRNPVGMALEPQSKALWAAVQERDMLGSDLVPDYISAIELGDHFGWPWYYWGGYPDPRVDPKNPALQQYAKRPDFAMGPHVAVLGLAFADGAKLGRFARGAFVAEHGSWNRKPVSGYKVVYVPFAANGFPVPNTKPVDVLTGFLNKDGKAQGRPAGLALDKTGALLVADDVGNRVWRVSAR